MAQQGGGPNRKESAVDLAKLIDKGIRVKLHGGREGARFVHKLDLHLGTLQLLLTQLLLDVPRSHGRAQGL